MSVGFVGVGLCWAQFDFCPTSANSVAHGTCNLVNVDRNERVDEVAPIDIAGGTPGKKCFYLELPNEELPDEVVIDTCTGTDPVLNLITGRMDYQAMDPVTGAALDGAAGVAMQKLKGSAQCFCACDDEDTGCDGRIALTIWRRAFCFGTEGQVHPGGRWAITHFPALEFRSTSQTTTLSNSADDGERFTFYAYTRPGYRGPGDILPDVYGPSWDACVYEWTSNICPPGGCDCGTCGDASMQPTPLAMGAFGGVAPAGVVDTRNMATPAAN